jgi:hypothetical protein
VGECCWICLDPILEGEESVETSKRPWQLERGIAHRDCADGAAKEAEMGRSDARREYERGR